MDSNLSVRELKQTRLALGVRSGGCEDGGTTVNN